MKTVFISHASADKPFLFHWTSKDVREVTRGQTLKNVTNHYYRGLEKMRQQIFGRKSLPKKAIW